MREGFKDVHVHFNITGRFRPVTRARNTFGVESNLQIGRTSIWSKRRFGFLFDPAAFREVPFPEWFDKSSAPKLHHKEFRNNDTHALNRTLDSNPDDEYGFVAKNRVPPRFLTGIVMAFWKPAVSGLQIENLVITQFSKLVQMHAPKTEEEMNQLEHEARQDVQTELQESRESIAGETNPVTQEKQMEEVVDAMKTANSNKPELWLPIYDFAGNLRWPKKMSYEEVKKIVSNKDETKT